MNQDIQAVLDGESQGCVVCGDCLEILPTLPDGCADLVLTDPPYGIDYQSARRTDRVQWKPKIANDKAPCLDWLHLTWGADWFASVAGTWRLTSWQRFEKPDTTSNRR